MSARKSERLLNLLITLEALLAEGSATLTGLGIGSVLAVVVAGGFSLVPIFVLAGVID